MPTSRRWQRLSDIVYYADLIFDHIGEDSYSDFEDSLKTIQAVERCLQCITEAAVKLGGEDVHDVFGLEMRDLKDLGNVLRHDYDRVAPKEIWNSVHNRLPMLRHAAAEKLEAMDRGDADGSD